MLTRLFFNHISCHYLTIVANVLLRARLAIKLIPDIIWQKRRILQLSVYHTALQRERELLDGRNRNDLRLDQAESCHRNLVHIPAALRATQRKYLFCKPVHRHIDRELRVAVDELAGVAARTYISDEYRALPHAADVALVDDHGVDLVTGFGCEEDAFL